MKNKNNHEVYQARLSKVIITKTTIIIMKQKTSQFLSRDTNKLKLANESDYLDIHHN